MNNKVKVWAISLFALLIFSIAEIRAQRSVEIYGAIGATVVNVDNWAGLSTNDWETGMSGWSIQVFPVGNETIVGGLEYGYSYLLWYIFNDGNFNVERNVDANRVMLVGRLNPAGNLITEFGVGLYLFDGFSDFSLAGGIGYKIKLTDQLSIPVKLRADLVLDPEAMMLPVGLNAGLAYSF